MFKFDYFGLGLNTLYVLKHLKAEFLLNGDHGINSYLMEVRSPNFVSLRVLLDVKESQHCCLHNTYNFRTS